ncbi:hypothetical protein QUF80_11475 [Desulfococcaceae bacterium HSG8]|nr:hypothetical protein [Desulfococcaceae bacterium HSG8]
MMHRYNASVRIYHLSDGNPAYSEDGTDLTLIRWMLSLTPAERLKVLQDNISSVYRLKHAGIRTRDNSDSERAS